MLRLYRYYGDAMTRDQSLDARTRGFRWNPVRNDTVRPLEESAIRHAANNIAYRRRACMQVLRSIEDAQGRNLISKSGRFFHPLRGSNNEWIVTECGGGGDCFFHSVATALHTDFTEVRKWTAETITVENVDRILKYYKEVYREGGWSRDAVMQLENVQDRVHALQVIVQKRGVTYQGDDTTMRMLVNHPTLRVGFLVFRFDGSMHHQCFLSRHTRKVVVLMHLPGHWRLVGQLCPGDLYGRVQVTFDPWSLPQLLTERLDGIGVDVHRDFSTWDPRLELEERRQREAVEERSQREVAEDQVQCHRAPPADNPAYYMNPDFGDSVTWGAATSSASMELEDDDDAFSEGTTSWTGELEQSQQWDSDVEMEDARAEHDALEDNPIEEWDGSTATDPSLPRPVATWSTLPDETI